MYSPTRRLGYLLEVRVGPISTFYFKLKYYSIKIYIICFISDLLFISLKKSPVMSICLEHGKHNNSQMS